jgi:hypothetical protein
MDLRVQSCVTSLPLSDNHSTPHTLARHSGLEKRARADFTHGNQREDMIRKLKSGEYRLYSRKKNPKTGKRRNLGTFKSRAAAEKHERAVQFFKRG